MNSYNGPAIFIDLTFEDQVVELRQYLNSLGSEIPPEKSPHGIEEDLREVIDVLEILFKDVNDSDVESVLNSVVSILVMIPMDRAESLIMTFSEKLTKTGTQKLGHVALRVLWLLFQSLEGKCRIRYHVYYNLLQVAKQIDQVRCIFTTVKQLKKQLEPCDPPITVEEMQKILRLLHDVLISCKESELAAKVMIELLGTYTTENAGHAKDDAVHCIVTALADPNTFLLDPLMFLKPVKCLKDTLIHSLLTVFVSEKLTDYLAFYEKNKDFVLQLGLNHEQNLTKMRLLTFMQLAEGSTEMSFDTITSELQINEDQVEEFIIDVLKTKLVRARMDQSARKVYIASTMHRTFSRPQWQQLRDTLMSWKTNLLNVQEGMKSVVAVQMERVAQ